MRRDKNAWDVVWMVIKTLIFIGLVFCIVTLILASIHEQTFTAEITSWFPSVLPTTPDEPVVETAVTSIKNTVLALCA